MLKSTYYKYKNNELLKAVAVYTTLSFVIKGISFLITPFFTHYITPEEFGSLNLFLTSIIFLTPIISVSSNSIINNYFNETKEVFEKKTSTYLTFSFLITLLLTLITLAFSNYVTAFFTLPISIIVVLPLTTFLSFLFDVVLLLARNESNKKRVFTATIIKTILEISLSIYFIMYLNMAGIGRILAFCLSNFLLSIWAILILFKKYNVVIYLKLEYLKEEYKFWFSTLFSFSFILILTVYDKLIAKYYFNDFEFGLYTFATQLGAILLTFTNAIQLAIQPQLIKSIQNGVSFLKAKTITIIIVYLSIAITLDIFYIILYKSVINHTYYNSIALTLKSTLVFLQLSIINIFFIKITFKKSIKFLNLFGLLSIVLLLPAEFISASINASVLISCQIIYCFFIIVLMTYLDKKHKFNL